MAAASSAESAESDVGCALVFLAAVSPPQQTLLTGGERERLESLLFAYLRSVQQPTRGRSGAGSAAGSEEAQRLRQAERERRRREHKRDDLVYEDSGSSGSDDDDERSQAREEQALQAALLSHIEPQSEAARKGCVLASAARVWLDQIAEGRSSQAAGQVRAQLSAH